MATTPKSVFLDAIRSSGEPPPTPESMSDEECLNYMAQRFRQAEALIKECFHKSFDWLARMQHQQTRLDASSASADPVKCDIRGRGWPEKAPTPASRQSMCDERLAERLADHAAHITGYLCGLPEATSGSGKVLDWAQLKDSDDFLFLQPRTAATDCLLIQTIIKGANANA